MLLQIALFINSVVQPIAVAARRDDVSMPDLVPEISEVLLVLDATVDPGDVAEGCAASTGPVDLLRFTTTVWNRGAVDLAFDPPECPAPCAEHPLERCDNPLFICSPAGGHNHAHFESFTRYELIDGGGGQVGRGHKFSFCIRDTRCDTPTYTCEAPGITAGCGDVYESSVGCQYVDVTGVPPGEYTLRVTVDPVEIIAEADESNNVAEVGVTIARTSPPCVGDCDESGDVTVDELVTAVNIVLDTRGPAHCRAFTDANGDGNTRLLRALGRALSGCP